jgi:transposase-like protein
MLTCMRWYVAYPLVLCHIKEMIALGRGDFQLTAKRDLAAACGFLECAIKHLTRLMLGFTLFWNVRIVIAAIKTMHMIK